MDRLKDRVAIVTGRRTGDGTRDRPCLRPGRGEGSSSSISTTDDRSPPWRRCRGQDGMQTSWGSRSTSRTGPRSKRGCNEIVEAWGRIDLLVNCAGGSLNTPYKLDEIEEKHWDLVVNVNLKGSFLCCQQVIPPMVKQGKGRHREHLRPGRPLAGLARRRPVYGGQSGSRRAHAAVGL